jgi:deoxycytidine triphosphate deaminase
VAERLEKLIHPPTQIHDYAVDLTVAQVYRVAGGGNLDFGGSEFAEAPREPLEPQLVKPDDKYGWWELPPGTYIVRYNEAVDPGERGIAFIQPHERTLLAGAYHPAFHFRGRREVLETLFIVGEGGCRLKENSRISKLLIFEVVEDGK